MNLEQAIALHRQGTPLSPSNPYHRLDTQEVLEASLLRARHQTQTYILVALFAIGLAFKTGDIIFDPQNTDHIVAHFLAIYFVEEPEAIHLVKDVSVTDIARSRKNHAAILAARPPRPTESTIAPLLAPTLVELFQADYKFGDEGLVSIGPGEMWYPTDKEPLFEEYQPLPEDLNWTPPDAALPESPDTRTLDDSIPQWLDFLAPSTDDKPCSKRPRISV